MRNTEYQLQSNFESIITLAIEKINKPSINVIADFFSNCNHAPFVNDARMGMDFDGNYDRIIYTDQTYNWEYVTRVIKLSPFQKREFNKKVKLYTI